METLELTAVVAIIRAGPGIPARARACGMGFKQCFPKCVKSGFAAAESLVERNVRERARLKRREVASS